MKIVFFDIDGSIYSYALGGITQNVKEAIDEARQKGILCFVASGRPYGFIAQNVKDIGFDGYVLSNGAQLTYQNKNLKVRYLNHIYLKELCKKLREKHIEYTLLTPKACYIRRGYTTLLEFYSKCNIDFENFIFDYGEEEIIEQTIKVEAWVKNEDEYQYVVSNLQHFSHELHPDNHSMEIYSPTVSKATGILDVLDLLDIDVSDSYCFGDGPNDVEMFETVGHPIAMGNAIDIIKEKAEIVCPSIEEDGVAVQLKKMF
ncbi:MAG: HAD family hydrolase [Erysipelotrichaceae bacterium]|nr:HAD family hydrolase [Erysipelotrichaceae bacterium]